MMSVTVGADVRVSDATPSVRRWAESNLVLDNPDYETARKAGRWTGNLTEKISLYVRDGADLILPFGCFPDLWRAGLLRGVPLKTEFHPFRGNSLRGDVKLYPYQERALEALLKGKNGVLEAPCGSGKTQIGLAFAQRSGCRTLWLTHTTKLLEQSLERAKSLLDGDFGVVTAGRADFGRDVTFATVQTMRTLSPKSYADAFDAVIVDECHHCAGSPTRAMMFYSVVSECNARYKIGLSATLSRGDGLMPSVYAVLGPKLHTVTKDEVGERIIKADHVRVDVPIDWPPSAYCSADGTVDYARMIASLSESAERNAFIAGTVRRLKGEGRRQLILCHRVSQVSELARLCSEFATVGEATGGTPPSRRDYGAEVVVATYAIAKEGLDMPDLDCVHFATPQKDETTTRQCAGRVERNVAGKRTPLVVDYVDKSIGYCETCYRKRRGFLEGK